MAATSLVRIARAAAHYWEEPCLSGQRGSGTIFFCGCALQCVFCQNREISRGRVGRNITVARLAEIYRELEVQGVHNLNFVTPTHFTDAILASFALYRPRVPIVWNTGGYETEDNVHRLATYVDIFLPDLKYLTKAVASRYCRRPDYPQVAQAAIRAMVAATGPAVFDDAGMLRRGTLVRHLVLPEQLDNTFRALDFLDTLPPGTLVSLMAQYTPCGAPSTFPELQRRLTADEYEQVMAYVDVMGGLDGYCQELDAADEAYIPPFDHSGVERNGK